MKCRICSLLFDFGDVVESPSIAVAICNELGVPVCIKHAKGCVTDGHGFRTFEEKLK